MDNEVLRTDRIKAAIKEAEAEDFGDYGFTDADHETVDTLIATASALLASKQAQQEPKLTPCRHCGFRVALNESPVAESEPVSGAVDERIKAVQEKLKAAGFKPVQSAALQPAQTGPLTDEQIVTLAKQLEDEEGGTVARRSTLVKFSRALLAQGAAPSQDGEQANLKIECETLYHGMRLAENRVRHLEKQLELRREALVAAMAANVTAHREAFEQCKEMAAKVCSEHAQAKSRTHDYADMYAADRLAEMIRALQCPEQPAAPSEDTEMLDFLTEFGSTWNVQWEKRGNKPVRYRMTDEGEAWGKWYDNPRAAIRAALAQQAGKERK